jgi:hypothetical protein
MSAMSLARDVCSLTATVTIAWIIVLVWKFVLYIVTYQEDD